MHLPVMYNTPSPSGIHCRSCLTAPSAVNWLKPLPSKPMTQTLLPPRKAIMSAPPSTGSAGTVGVGLGAGVSVGLGVRPGAEVPVGSIISNVGEGWTAAMRVGTASVGAGATGNRSLKMKKIETMPAHNRTVAALRPIHSPVFLRGGAPAGPETCARPLGCSPRLATTV